MTDRNVQYPYRFHVKPVPGTDDICEIIPAPGEVFEEGTFWNKANVLDAATEIALWGDAQDRTPNEALARLRALVQQVDQKIKIMTGTYEGTGTNKDTKTIILDFTPKFFVCQCTKTSATYATHKLALWIENPIYSVYRSLFQGGSSSGVEYQEGTITGNTVELTGNYFNVAGSFYSFLAIG